MRALIIEDDLPTVQLISLSLQQHGFEIEIADNIIDALATLEQESEIRLVTLDMVLPGLNGRTLINVIHDQFPHIKILVISAHSLDPEQKLGPKLQKLAKPFRYDHLRRILQDLGFASMLLS